MICMLGCDTCFSVLRIVGDSDTTRTLIRKHSAWKDGWPCVGDACESKMRLIPESELEGAFCAHKAELLKIVDISPEDAFRALSGFGLPDELSTDIEVVRALLLTSKIVSVGLRGATSRRSILDSILLENGLKIHLTSSPAGPVVYKISRSSGG